MMEAQLGFHSVVWYYNIFFYLFIAELIFTTVMGLIYSKRFRLSKSESKLMQQQHTAKIDNIRKDHSDTLEKIRMEMLKREEERGRQWMESERETLHVLGGVSNLLDLSEKFNRVESDKIIKILLELQEKIEKKLQ